MRRGFTVIELVIVITIMGILLVLAVVNLNSSQEHSRDSERKSDAEAIAIMFESYYNNASNESTVSPGSFIGKTYPAIDVITNATTFRSSFPDADPKLVRTPGVAESSPMSLVPATVATIDPLTIMPSPATTNDIYVYQPLRNDGSLCTTFSESNPCQKFNLYYLQETSSTVEVLASKRQ